MPLIRIKAKAVGHGGPFCSRNKRGIEQGEMTYAKQKKHQFYLFSPLSPTIYLTTYCIKLIFGMYSSNLPSDCFLCHLTHNFPANSTGLLSSYWASAHWFKQTPSVNSIPISETSSREWAKMYKFWRICMKQ